MNQSVTEKILQAHLVEGTLEPGQEIGIRIDQTLTQDATGTMVYLQFESMGLKKVATELAVSYVDHNTVQDGFENADDHRYLQTVAARYGILYSRCGNGICHQVHLERFAVPGKTLLGSDSHTPTGGGLGMLAIGAGGIEVALAMAGRPFYCECPRVIRINLHGQLPPWSSAKDVILKVLQMLTTKGHTGTVIEYGGDGLAGLSVPERATITNMGAELGVTTSVFPSDQVTKAFLSAQGRPQLWHELHADQGARYAKTLDLDLVEIPPLVARPHSPDNVCAVKEIADLKVDQVIIGSCTNSSYKDLMIVAGILKGRRVHPYVSLVISPASRQVFKMLADNGALAIFVEAGARIQEPVCGFCIGNCHAPKTDGVSLRTSNRNFKGRSGTKSAQIYLVSPETAAVSALAGVLTDPAAGGGAFPVVKVPDRFAVDDSMIVAPPPEKEREKVVISRGPNIGAPLTVEPLPDRLTGAVEIKVGDKVTTDDIMPAGARLKYRSNIQKYAEFVFEQVDPEFSKRCLENKTAGIASFIVGGESYGQGSSREHAAICPRYLGVRAVIAKSFERIHFANLVNFGIVPMILARPADYERLSRDDTLEISGLRQAVLKAEHLSVKNKTQDMEFAVRLNLSVRQRAILIEGGVLNYAKQHVPR